MVRTEGIDPARLLSIFLDLVRIDSESGSEGEAAAYVKDFFEDIGVECAEDGCGRRTLAQSGNLVARMPATGGFSGKPFILSAHLDTVAPGIGVVPRASEDRIESSGETVLGADDKAGVAAILSAVEALRQNGAEHRPLEVVLTVQEENGLVGSRNLDYFMLEGECGVVLDSAGAVGGIVLEAPTRHEVKFVIGGRSAHAGVEPEKGKNAICCAAEAIASLDTGRLDEHTTTNIATIAGGRATNIVPDRVVVEGEVRAFSGERASTELERMVCAFKRAAERGGCSLEHESEQSFRHFRVDPSSTPASLLATAMRECGIEPTYETSGGGSDANVFNKTGITAVTMHIGVENTHSTREYITRRDLLMVARIVMALATTRDDGMEP